MSDLKNIYQPIRAEIQDIIEESPTVKTFVMIPETTISFTAGKFIQLTLNGYGEAPFTPSSSPYSKDKIEVTMMKAGYLTEKFHSMKPGEMVGIRGPFGNGYPLDQFYGKDILILSGGCGLAPIRSLLFVLENEAEKFNKITLCYGSKTPSDCIYKPLFDRLDQVEKFKTLRTVDHPEKGWHGSVGVVTNLLDNLNINLYNTVAIVCGPPVMMKFSTIRLLEMGLNDNEIFLSMEKNMSCGVGKCGHCAVGIFSICKDGPVFSYSDLKNTHDVWK